MARKLTLLLAAAALAFPLALAGGVPPVPARGGEPAPPASPEGGLPVGRWGVEFANGVKETCEIRRDGTASVAEPLRAAAGEVEVRGGSFVIVYRDDRTERWTPVGKRFVVEHWFPGSRLPTVTPVLGIAERVQ